VTRQPERGGSRAVAGERLLRPLIIASVCVLVVNDHWLKAAYPGVVTGKLSDIAGLVFFPSFLQALWEMLCAGRGKAFEHSRRLLYGCSVLSVAGFVFVKLFPVGGSLYSVVLGAIHGVPKAIIDLAHLHLPELPRARLVQDPGDLLALPVAFLDFLLAKKETISRGCASSA
jgi:hypothetical protein